jgi:cephalosporin hydroxylase
LHLVAAFRSNKNRKRHEGGEMSTKEATAVGSDLNPTRSLDDLIATAIHETTPHWVIEIGNRNPVSTLYHGYLLSQLGEASHTLVSITGNLKEMPQRRNIYYIDEAIHIDVIRHLEKLINPLEKVMVILSDAGCRNPLTTIQKYSPLVTEGCYLVMNDAMNHFAVEKVAFEPDWTMRGSQLYFRETGRAWSRDPASALLFQSRS